MEDPQLMSVEEKWNGQQQLEAIDILYPKEKFKNARSKQLT
jgi:hypothetical protein